MVNNINDLDFFVTFYKDDYKMLRIRGNQLVASCFLSIIRHVLGKEINNEYYTDIEVTNNQNEVVFKTAIADFNIDLDTHTDPSIWCKPGSFQIS